MDRIMSSLAPSASYQVPSAKSVQPSPPKHALHLAPRLRTTKICRKWRLPLARGIVSSSLSLAGARILKGKRSASKARLRPRRVVSDARSLQADSFDPVPAQAQQAERGDGWQKEDARFNPTWLDIQARGPEDLAWAHPQTFWGVGALVLCFIQMWRCLHGLAPPSTYEVCAAGIVYAGLFGSRYQEVELLPKHYRVTFYASCGWAFYSFASLADVTWGTPALHAAGAAVFLGSCAVFYAYHWGRMYRHWCEGRFRPWFAFGIGGLFFLHLLSVAHIWKELEDPGWWPIVAKIYPQQWHWIADIRLAELFLTAVALFLVICHEKGVLTGTRNAAVVFGGTIFLPAFAIFVESTLLKGVSTWQHYLMVGPKHF